MAKAKAMPADERRWRVEQDARTLAEARVIGKDRGRLAAARTAAKGMAKTATAEADAMKQVSVLEDTFGGGRRGRRR